MSTRTNKTGDRALSSEDGKSWWDGRGRSSFPEVPDPRVRRLVLGSLEDGKALPLEGPVRAALGNVAKHFPGLTHLHLWGLGDLEAVDGLPKGLETLDIRKCPRLARVGKVGSALRRLDLADCAALRELPGGSLATLEEVWLDGCEALEAFEPLTHALKSLKRLELYNCRFVDLDPGLCGERGQNVAASVRGYFEALESQGPGSWAECKIVVLGDGGVGKTELVRALKGLPFDGKQKSTDGIRLWKWGGGTEDKPVPDFAPSLGVGVKEVHINVWDFGGQDLYHNTHRLFLESRAVFVVVWRQPKWVNGEIQARRPNHKEDAIRPLDYWFDQVRAFNPRAAIVMVRTGTDEDAEFPPEPWREQVREEYRGLRSFEVSAMSRGAGVDTLREHLLDLVKKELRGALAVVMPSGRVEMRKELAKYQPAWDDRVTTSDSKLPMLRRIEYAEMARKVFRRACVPVEPDDAEIGWQLAYFHHSGALYAPSRWMADPDLRNSQPLIVDQRWIIDGIYQLFLKGSVGRERLLISRGWTSVEELEDIWNQQVSETGQARYDSAAQWVMRRYMEDCGLLLVKGDENIFPEFLPNWPDLEKTLGRTGSHLLVAKAMGPRTKSRRYWIRHRHLGQGFGCLLVAVMARHFPKAPIFRYGAIAVLEIGEAGTRGARKVVIRVEWGRELERENEYQGDISATIFGPRKADAEVLQWLLEKLEDLPGFPRGLRFESAEGQAQVALAAPMQLENESRPERPAVAPWQPLGIVGLSYAGNNPAEPDVEFWPRAIERRLNAIAGGHYDILLYKRDKDRNNLPDLVRDLIQTDIMLAVIGRKYLHSRYCMAEFHGAARHHAPRNTFEKPARWLERVWPVKLTNAAPYLKTDEELRPGPDRSRELDWKTRWMKRGIKYYTTILNAHDGEDDAEQVASTANVYHEWMAFARKGRKGLGFLVGAISGARRFEPLPDEYPPGLSGPALDRWADGVVKAIVDEVHEFMGRVIVGLSEGVKRDRALRACARHWACLREDDAIRALSDALNYCDPPDRARQEARAGRWPFGKGVEDRDRLEAVLKAWWQYQTGAPTP